MEIKQILYINKTKFIGDTVLKICKRKGVECYTLENMEDFAYLIDDLNPEAVVIEQSTFNINPELFWAGIKSAKTKTITVLMGEKQEGFDVYMELPLDMIHFIDELGNKLTEFSKRD